MKLKRTLETLDNLDKAFHPLYEEKDGAFHLIGVEGDEDTAKKLKEFRENNIAKARELEELKTEVAKFKGVDPEKYAEMQKAIENMGDQKLLDDGKLDELMEQRTERLRAEWEGKFAVQSEALDTAREGEARYKGMVRKSAVQGAVSKAISDIAVVKKGALDDIHARALQTWNVDENGDLIALNPNGTKVFGKDGKDPITMQEWAEELTQTAGFLFEPNTGGNAGGGSTANKQEHAKGTILSTDKEAFSGNIEDIAKGNVQVAV